MSVESFSVVVPVWRRLQPGQDAWPPRGTDLHPAKGKLLERVARLAHQIALSHRLGGIKRSGLDQMSIAQDFEFGKFGTAFNGRANWRVIGHTGR